MVWSSTLWPAPRKTSITAPLPTMLSGRLISVPAIW
jgi:hypothetical protein